MRNILLIAISACFLASCSNNSNSVTTYCDTTCTNDTLKFYGDHPKWKQTLSISMKNCSPDSMIYTYEGASNVRTVAFSDYGPKEVHLNKSNINVGFQDSVSIWVSFNDCFTGRGYLFELPYRSGKSSVKTTAALNSIDKKFSVDPDLRAFTDRGNIFIVNVTNGKQAQMTFKENYADMNFNDIHKTLDSINVTKTKVYVKLLKEGKEVPLEKNISL